MAKETNAVPEAASNVSGANEDKEESIVKLIGIKIKDGGNFSNQKTAASPNKEKVNDNTSDVVNGCGDNAKETADGSLSKPEEPIDALTLLNNGKRNLACDEIPQACEALADACRLLVQKYGRNAPELPDAHFYYGKALLELARLENGVLGNALDGVAPEEEIEADLSESEQFGKTSEIKAEERMEVIEKIYDAMSEQKNEKAECSNSTSDEVTPSSSSEPSNEQVTSTDTPDNPTESAEDSTKDAKDEGSTEKVEENKEKVTTSDGEMEEDADVDVIIDDESSEDDENCVEEVSNLQLAWEVLELAKKMYGETEGRASKLKMADVLLTLGQVGVEAEQYDGALLDINECLKIQTEHLDADNRLLAETHYQLGLVHLLCKSYGEAVKEFKLAMSVIEVRIANLEKLVSGEDVDNKTKLVKELNELKLLLPELANKVEDAEDESTDAERAVTEIKSALGLTTQIGFGDSTQSTTAPSTIGVKRANDITNLVRKRKTEEEDAPDETKKIKSDSSETIDKENGHVNTAADIKGE